MFPRSERAEDDAGLVRDWEYDDDACDVPPCEERVKRERRQRGVAVLGDVEIRLRRRGERERALRRGGERLCRGLRARVDGFELEGRGLRERDLGE